MSNESSGSTTTKGYQRRLCSKCGEGLGFTESDPCERCADEADAQREPELKDCPFCGGKPAWGEGEQKTKYGNEQVYCSNCYAVTPPEMTKAEAARNWNWRVSDTRSRPTVEAAEIRRQAFDEAIQIAKKLKSGWDVDCREHYWISAAEQIADALTAARDAAPTDPEKD